MTRHFVLVEIGLEKKLSGTDVTLEMKRHVAFDLETKIFR